LNRFIHFGPTAAGSLFTLIFVVSTATGGAARYLGSLRCANRLTDINFKVKKRNGPPFSFPVAGEYEPRYLQLSAECERENRRRTGQRWSENGYAL